MRQGTPADITQKIAWKAWVPTVLGNLSFSLVGRNGWPFPFIKPFPKDELRVEDDSQDDASSQRVVIYQRRIPPDVKIPFLCVLPARLYLPLSAFLLKVFKQERFVQHFVVSFEREAPEPCSGAAQKVKGTIYATTHLSGKDRRALKRYIERAELNEIDRLLGSLRGSRGVLIQTDFTLDRQGFCDLQNIEIQGLERAEGSKGADLDAAADICFYFLRDLFHIHKHHDRWEERLIHAYRATGDWRWAENVVKDLLRYLIRHRQESDQRVVGVFAYLDTLLKMLDGKVANEDLESGDSQKSHAKMDGGHLPNPTAKYIWQRLINLKGLKRSIENELKIYRQRQENKRWFFGAALVLVGMGLLYVYQFWKGSAANELPFGTLREHPAFMVTAILVLGLGGVKMSELISGTPLAMRMRCLVEPMIQLGSTRLRHFLWVSALALLSGGLAWYFWPF